LLAVAVAGADTLAAVAPVEFLIKHLAQFQQM
jgi:hypothetical protein